VVEKDDAIDTIISIGGGSPIDSAKAISYRLKQQSKKDYLYHIAIPTTLSAAECTMLSGYTNPDGKKVSFRDPKLVPQAVLYDSRFALETPQRLFMATGLRALDHCIETLYHPDAAEVPTKQSALSAASGLFVNLPKYKENPRDEAHITNLQLAAYGSLGEFGTNMKHGLGLSHSLGYALGAPYGIPHGETSCITLGHVIKLKAQDAYSAAQIARVLPFIGSVRTGDDRADAEKVGDQILQLVDQLGLTTKLGTDWHVGEDQIPTITKLATGSESGTLYEDVSKLVKGLY
jgi:alcohol dehydrogenase class IV